MKNNLFSYTGSALAYAKPHTDQDSNLTNVQTKSDSNKNNYS
jgi:hypothetical protein